MVMPHLQNPLGFQMPDEKKRALVEMLTSKAYQPPTSDIRTVGYCRLPFARRSSLNSE
ncbi:hypothetical protein LMG26411_05294 [Cupriavidus numazuensis]|uniref:Uncharacterized protein n=1 Tax=Cupriavidus numazuensis TaxID=221992 RepID=A0ABN7Q4D2_9BURK|nr:hypothetical protein LMG26411_05294 [Cupriavidus numazuensis]